MIVIKARGATDVRSLKKLADSLGADDMPSVAQSARAGKPTISLLSGVLISPQTREAILNLEAVEIDGGGEYDLA
jgi:hypothetical protein